MATKDGKTEVPAEEPATEQTAQDAVAAAFSTDALGELMTSEGPVCKCVLLSAAKGTTTEIDVDMTPKTNNCAKLLGGQPTFIGQWPEIGVILMMARDAPAGSVKNTIKLPYPFHKIPDGEIVGDILLVRMDDSSNPADITLAEYEKFAAERFANPPTEEEEAEREAAEAALLASELAAEETAGADDESEEEDEPELESDSEDDDEDGLSPIQQMIFEQVMNKLKETLGREPTEEEAAATMEKLNASGQFAGIMQRFQAMAGEDEEEEEEAEETEEAEKGKKEEGREQDVECAEEEDQENTENTGVKNTNAETAVEKGEAIAEKKGTKRSAEGSADAEMAKHTPNTKAKRAKLAQAGASLLNAGLKN